MFYIVKGSDSMNLGYVRLSRDDDKHNYVSIENQKLIITQFAAKQNDIIDRWYEDDGFSGYSFNRPGFQELMKELNTPSDITVYVKDFSRLGRHNAKVLLLLDKFLEQDKRLIVIDDNYDSAFSDDDTIGIKTWYNERYVKDTSKKICSALRARQKEGTLMTYVPFGYRRNEQKKEVIEIIPVEAEYIKLIFDLYIKGSGYRKISAYLTSQNIPTPSMIRRDRELAEGRNTKRKVVTIWAEGMVKEILDNDFYIGTFRLHKRVRKTVHGKDRRVPKEEQYMFEDHHPAIIDKMTFDLVQEIKSKRAKTNYRGSHGQWLGSDIPNLFGSCLFCKDCGSRLTPIKRNTATRQRKYYICSMYNTKGKKYCASAHLIEETDLMNDITHYISLCRDALTEIIATYNVKDYESEKKSLQEKRQTIQNSLAEQKQQLKILFSQKIKELARNPDNEDLITESYNNLQSDILSHIQRLELKLRDLSEATLETPDVKKKLRTALDIVDDVIGGQTLKRSDIELLIERITVDVNGLPGIELKYGLSGIIKYDPTEELNRQESEITLTVLQLIQAETRGYTSARYLSTKLEELAINKSKKAVLPYIKVMIEKGVLEPTEDLLKPYTIMKFPEELATLSENDPYLHLYMPDRWHAADGI